MSKRLDRNHTSAVRKLYAWQHSRQWGSSDRHGYMAFLIVAKWEWKVKDLCHSDNAHYAKDLLTSLDWAMFTIIGEVCSSCTEMAELVLRKYHDSSRKSRGIFKARRVFLINIVQSDSFLCQQIDEHKREAFSCELTHSRLVTIIANVSMTFEILPVVWIAYSLLDLSQT